jgi:hypothetical protein
VEHGLEGGRAKRRRLPSLRWHSSPIFPLPRREGHHGRGAWGVLCKDEESAPVRAADSVGFLVWKTREGRGEPEEREKKKGGAHRKVGAPCFSWLSIESASLA